MNRRPTVGNHILLALVFLAAAGALWFVLALATGQITVHTN